MATVICLCPDAVHIDQLAVGSAGAESASSGSVDSRLSSETGVDERVDQVKFVDRGRLAELHKAE